ncbi:acetylcholine receptor subunit alpha-like [Stegodyphus dumicola]|uniref:acetylcholine receptor subunit alpha-like n=1 Tax=Stegodyphus dumicola TaxID=202533 RepID=UPI0015B08B42|nr:acetylcholine receptor subunit alpha-like [Stegodyphus dumicola]
MKYRIRRRTESYRPCATPVYNRDVEDVAGRVDAKSIPDTHAGSGLRFEIIASPTQTLCYRDCTNHNILRNSRTWLVYFFLSCLLILGVSEAHPAAKRLHDDLLSDYNRLIRPVGNHSHKVTVHLGLKLSQLIDINLKHQVMTTNVWVEQTWHDYKLKWDPSHYGGVEMIHVPAEHIWLPDIVLFNNADGNYEVTLMTKATVYYSGEIVWKPPALYKSTCEIDVEYFPFDEQSCLMKFGSWTYDGYEVDLRHVKQEEGSSLVPLGIDMSEFYKSVEWDILLVPAKYNEEYYDCCVEPYPDITFNITMRRKTLFYTVNLIIPCVGISFLTVLVFYLPSDSGEKVTLCISILVSLTVFFLLLAEIIPPTSLAVPLLGKYLLFTMILVTLSISVTVGVLNVHFRSPSTHEMSPWVKRVFIHIMPRLLLMRRPLYASDDELTEPPKFSVRGCNGVELRRQAEEGNGPQLVAPLDSLHVGFGRTCEPQDIAVEEAMMMGNGTSRYKPYTPETQKAIESILFIAEHIRKEDEEESVVEDWKYVAMVLDRLFLWIFTIASLVGTCGILLQAPSLYDDRIPIEGFHVA